MTGTQTHVPGPAQNTAGPATVTHTPGRIFCIGRNYAAHIAELGNAADSACLIFMKPASGLVAEGAVLQLPKGRGEVHHEAELVVRIGRGGRDIAAADALAHIDAFTLGLDLTLRELQADLKARGAPWELAKAFDGSAPLGRFVERGGEDFSAFEFQLRVNGETRQHGNTARMLFGVPELIRILSAHFTLHPGDMVFTGTPAGVAALHPGDRIELHSEATGALHWTVGAD